MLVQYECLLALSIDQYANGAQHRQIVDLIVAFLQGHVHMSNNSLEWAELSEHVLALLWEPAVTSVMISVINSVWHLS